MYSGNFLKKAVSLFIAVILLSGTLFISFPKAAEAFTVPFGGKTVFIYTACLNGGFYVVIGPPRGGDFIWGLGTMTYLFGPPSLGRWNLGIASPPSLCVVSYKPFFAYYGLFEIMLGTSGI